MVVVPALVCFESLYYCDAWLIVTELMMPKVSAREIAHACCYCRAHAVPSGLNTMGFNRIRIQRTTVMNITLPALNLTTLTAAFSNLVSHPTGITLSQKIGREYLELLASLRWLFWVRMWEGVQYGSCYLAIVARERYCCDFLQRVTSCWPQQDYLRIASREDSRMQVMCCGSEGIAQYA